MLVSCHHARKCASSFPLLSFQFLLLDFTHLSKLIDLGKNIVVKKKFCSMLSKVHNTRCVKARIHCETFVSQHFMRYSFKGIS